MFPGFESLMMPWIGKTMKHMDAFLSCKLTERGITVTRQQMITMKILFHDGPLPQHNLAFITDRDKTSLTRLITGMEKKNLVARIPSRDDKRINLIHLTTTGEKVLNETMPELLKLMHELQAGVSESDQEAVIRAMKQIQTNIENQSNSCISNKPQ
jgi:DNA-binding MarR family transcriptional regulator